MPPCFLQVGPSGFCFVFCFVFFLFCFLFLFVLYMTASVCLAGRFFVFSSCFSFFVFFFLCFVLVFKHCFVHDCQSLSCRQVRGVQFLFSNICVQFLFYFFCVFFLCLVLVFNTHTHTHTHRTDILGRNALGRRRGPPSPWLLGRRISLCILCVWSSEFFF